MDWFELDKDDEETIADITEESQLNKHLGEDQFEIEGADGQ
jgi:hypothetical protein